MGSERVQKGMMTLLINHRNQMKTGPKSDYEAKVTADNKETM